jgi:polysaccharide export outer membrane protein
MCSCFRLFAGFVLAFIAVPAHAEESVIDNNYRVGAGDIVDIQVFGEKDLSGAYPVSEDGGIDFPLLGRVSTENLSIDGLDGAITDGLAAKYLRDPQVQVTVTSYGSQPVQVLGAVKNPGVFHLGGPTSVLDIIAEAGGVKEGGVSEVRVKHKNPELETYSVKLDQLVGDTTSDIQLTAGDVVFVSAGMVVYVSGEVAKPGAVPFIEGLTVTQALTRSGGTKRTAKMRDAYILRGSERISINIKKILAGRSADVALMPNDQVILKESIF